MKLLSVAISSRLPSGRIWPPQLVFASILQPNQVCPLNVVSTHGKSTQRKPKTCLNMLCVWTKYFLSIFHTFFTFVMNRKTVFFFNTVVHYILTLFKCYFTLLFSILCHIRGISTKYLFLLLNLILLWILKISNYCYQNLPHFPHKIFFLRIEKNAFKLLPSSNYGSNHIPLTFASLVNPFSTQSTIYSYSESVLIVLSKHLRTI